MISSGNNFPSVNVRTDRLIDVCVALHRRRTPASIAEDLALSGEELGRRLDSLLEAELVKRRPSGQCIPSFPVITLEEARWMAPGGEATAETARLIAAKLPEIRARAESIPGIRRAGFRQAAFLILSDVLLDNWQIGNVESLFLKAERPLRNGRRYYFALLEKLGSERSEPFGIYGNAQGGSGGTQAAVYGKNRYDGNTLVSISAEECRRLFGIPKEADARRAMMEMLARVAELARTGKDRLSPQERAGLGKLGLMENGELRVTVLSGAEAVALGDVAGLVTADLLGVLERRRAGLERTFERSPYQEETTFNEFFMWWYHFFYTAVTDRLAREGLLEIPASGNTTYLIAG